MEMLTIPIYCKSACLKLPTYLLGQWDKMVLEHGCSHCNEDNVVNRRFPLFAHLQKDFGLHSTVVKIYHRGWTTMWPDCTAGHPSRRKQCKLRHMKNHWVWFKLGHSGEMFRTIGSLSGWTLRMGQGGARPSAGCILLWLHSVSVAGRSCCSKNRWNTFGVYMHLYGCCGFVCSSPCCCLWISICNSPASPFGNWRGKIELSS